MTDNNMPFPLLLDPLTYNPDTVDLKQDNEARQYWFECFKQLIKKFSLKAAESQIHDSTAEDRAEQFYKDYINKIEKLKNNEEIIDRLTIRTLLDMNETGLKHYGFDDPWKKQKELENSASIKLLKRRLDAIDRLKDDERWMELFRGVLAGNVFDWGASAVADILQNDISFGLDEALQVIENRPWLIDNMDTWLERVKCEHHKCAIIFVDNSGVDIILGIMPFARELLLRNTKVILCANSEPSLNDVTYLELIDIVQQCCDHCEILQKAYNTDNTLMLYPNGQSGACLDLMNMPQSSCDAILENNTDLVVIEGMGRSLHTNLNATFKCDALKLAVIKNRWLANRLGGDIFSIICKYEKATTE